jgi:predicted MFS family arabinose efflux permease
LNGQPAAWIVGMPILGIVGERSWRLGWLVLPFAAALAAGVLIARRAPRSSDTVAAAPREAIADPALRRWLLSELLANAGWAGTLVYAGALFAETYHSSARATGVLLAGGASAYVLGNVLSRRLARTPSQQRLAALALCLSGAVALFGAERPNTALSTALFAVAAFFAGSRTLVASAFGLSVAPALRASLTSLRAATMQFGYFLGSIVAGTALASSGYRAFGLSLGLLFLLAAATLMLPRLRVHKLDNAGIAVAPAGVWNWKR